MNQVQTRGGSSRNPPDDFFREDGISGLGENTGYTFDDRGSGTSGTIQNPVQDLSDLNRDRPKKRGS